MDCLFCKIAAGDIPAAIVFQDTDVVAFRDIQPLAPVHIVIVPRQHIPSVNDLTDADIQITGKLLLTAKQIAAAEGIAQSGYRLSINCGHDGTQVVPHIHLHLLGGRLLSGNLG